MELAGATIGARAPHGARRGLQGDALGEERGRASCDARRAVARRASWEVGARSLARPSNGCQPLQFSRHLGGIRHRRGVDLNRDRSVRGSVLLDDDDVRRDRPPRGRSVRPAPLLLSVTEVCVRFGVTRSWIYAHARELGAIRLGPSPRARLRFEVSPGCVGPWPAGSFREASRRPRHGREF